MKRRIFSFLAAVALVGLFGSAKAEAARHPVKGRRVASPAVSRHVFPRYRQIDGKSLWDLGKQNGRWPKL